MINVIEGRYDLLNQSRLRNQKHSANVLTLAWIRRNGGQESHFDDYHPPPAWEKELDMSPNSRQLGPPDTADIDTALHIPRSLLKEFSPKFQDFLPAHQEGRVFVYDA